MNANTMVNNKIITFHFLVVYENRFIETVCFICSFIYFYSFIGITNSVAFKYMPLMLLIQSVHPTLLLHS
jgi:hypothetical protein